MFESRVGSKYNAPHMAYTPTIGLEIHAELKTLTKMFCRCKNESEATEPNVHICPVCMAHPGTLPVINKEAVRHVLRIGTAVGGHLADFTEFDRKNYFYPDIPKGYQISQYQYPLISGGAIRGIELTRIHLEEDTARSQHLDSGDSVVDFNRAGLPLMELVTEPVVPDAESAVAFAKELQLLLRYIDASDANMEKGQMRVEANISVSETKEFGTKVEVKNLNSFKAVERAIAYEIDRQIALIESGEKVKQETRGWDDAKQKTFSQRTKENSEDNRYFPDPDLPKLKLSELDELSDKTLRATLPELPWEKRERLASQYGIKDEDVEMYVRDERYGHLFDIVAKSLKEHVATVRLASNYITSDIAGQVEKGEKGVEEYIFLNEKVDDFAKSFAKLMHMVEKGDVSSRGAKDVLAIMLEKGGDPETIAKKEGLVQKSDEGEMRTLAEGIIAEHEDVANEYKAGKESALQFLIGQGMKATKGSANPQILKKLFETLLQ